MGLLGKGQAQVKTLAGQAYNVTFVQNRTTGFHEARLVGSRLPMQKTTVG